MSKGGTLKMTSLGDLFIKYECATNPVTRSVLREIIANRLDRLEDKSK